MASILLGVWCVEWRWRVSLLVCPVQWCSPCLAHPSAVLSSTAVVSCAVRCRVCGVVQCVCLYSFAWWGILCALPPPQWWRGWLSWMVGWHGGVGRHGVEGRACCVTRAASARGRVMSLTIPLCCYCPPVRVLLSPVSFVGAVMLKGGCACCCDARVRIGLASCIVLLPLLHTTLWCVYCHSIVGLGCVFCGRVVSLWGSDDGLWGAEWRPVSTVAVGPSCVACAVVVAYVVSHCVVGCGMAVCDGVWFLLLVFSVLFLLFFFFVDWCSG